MDNYLRELILSSTKASNLKKTETIQELWSGYGSIKRFSLAGSEIKSVVVKHVSIPSELKHPKGWLSNKSHERKLKSYEIEMNWYENFSKQLNVKCYTPKCYALKPGKNKNYFLMVLEDLNLSGFPLKKTSASISEIKVCLEWLAHFHATFLGQSPTGLWETGTYWHLETRPDELSALKDKELRRAAKEIDEKLKSCPFQTFVHGDAKLANFCFSKDSKKAAAVDFQYVGAGCGVKDVAYFIGSCLEESQVESKEAELLDFYFNILQSIIEGKNNQIDTKSLISSWRALYPFAVADFHRFLKGWSPKHWKINSYSERITKEVIDSL